MRIQSSENKVGVHVVLVGPMGVGKTTIGRALANRWGWTFLDSDETLEDDHGSTGAEIAAGDGVERLHALELEAFAAMAAEEKPSVISPAASVVDTEKGRALLGRHLTVWLDAPTDVLSRRRHLDDHRRPIDATEEKALDERRQPHWARLAAMRVDTARPVEETVQKIARGLRRHGLTPPSQETE